MIDHSPAYRCKIADTQSGAWLKLGSRKKPVQVVEQSRDMFTVRVSRSLAQKVRVGGEFRFFYQDMLWSVLCKHKWISQNELVDLEFEPLRELTAPKIQKDGWFGRSTPLASTTPLDGTLAVVFLGTILLSILIMPAWGGQWGTSKLICDAVTSVWKALASLVTGQAPY
ncbi:hypothetical protein VN12_02470 [Pirellula sp. SH-Sr6A]|uniref:hypothetical protein n=1 Tax=Pirellula sp. SH-Sr6A TaxID=1632865 RepID=UPI00078EAD7C|nr:hypothetical protein [Pirellula sp. SH-Sr6A]AMV30951.1 hypothetical protein VN12_02470 [Pirellula sp. SH-Sr6A]